MPGTASLLSFAVAALVVLLIPGPGVLYVVARSVSQGPRAGLVSTLGLSTGALVHVVGATVGLSAILLTSATAFGVVKALGAGYLIYLGLRALVTRESRVDTSIAVPRTFRRLFTDGVIVSVFNPKIAVFFLAFLPQFAEPSRGPVARQVLFLGLLYVVLALCTDSGYAFVAGRLRNLFVSKLSKSAMPRVLSGVVYMGLGVTTALVDRK